MPPDRSFVGKLVVATAFVALFGTDTTAAFAQESVQGPETPAPRALSLADALAYARAHQPLIRAALARVSAQRALADVPRAQWLPTVGATAQIFAATSNNTSAGYATTPYLDITRVGGTPGVAAEGATWSPYASTFAAIGVRQEIFDFGRIAAQSATADALVEARTHDADAERLLLELSVEEAFFAVRSAKAVLDASTGAVERSRVHRDQARAGVQSGLRPPVDLTRAEADLQTFDNGRIRARGGVAVAESVLAATLGAPEPLVDAADTPITPAQMPALADAIRAATARDPVLLNALAQLKAQEAQTRAIGAELRPNLFATGAISGRAGGAAPSNGGERPDGAGFVPSVPNWNVGLVLSWPLFDGTVSARRDASSAAEQVRRDEIEVARQRLVAAIHQAYVGVDVVRATLPGLQRAVDAAIANYAQSDARFGAGLGTSVELADAEALRARAEIDLAIGSFDLAKARAAFGRAIAEGL